MKDRGAWLLLGMLVGCSKATPTVAPATETSSAASSVSASNAASSAAPSAAPAVAPTPPAVAIASSEAPASFKGGVKESIGDAVGLGCEPTSLAGWLQLLCRKKNGTGGHPVRAVIHGGSAAPRADGEPAAADQADASDAVELSANEQGELNIVVPFSGEERRDVLIEWTDTSYTLHVTGAKATLEWAASGIPHRRACQQLLDESKAAQLAAQKLEGEARLTTSEAAKLGRFGVCKPAGLGSWALALKSASGKGDGSARVHHLDLDVVRVDVDGKRQRASFGSFDVVPGSLEFAALQAYDYDDDGRDELIVPYEIKASAPGIAPSFVAPIWSFSDSAIAPYAKAPTVTGGIGVEQLDFDMRPDFGTYAGFVAYLGADCGLKVCPSRITGPKTYLHSLPNGSFSDNDEAARSALKRACSSKPASVIVESGGSLNAVQTAHNLVCSRAWGVPPEAIEGELTRKHAALCGEASACPLQVALEAWSKRSLPVSLP